MRCRIVILADVYHASKEKMEIRGQIGVHMSDCNGKKGVEVGMSKEREDLRVKLMQDNRAVVQRACY